MSFALDALLLMRLDARAGALVAVDDLAQHVGTSGSTVQAALASLAERSLLEVVTEGSEIVAARVPNSPEDER